MLYEIRHGMSFGTSTLEPVEITYVIWNLHRNLWR